MKNAQSNRKQRKGPSERGVALIIAIFTLMLISVIATAMILMAGTQTAIKANYKSSMQAFYNAKAGLEEGRSRLWVGNANSLNSCAFPTPGSPMPINYVCYIVNPDPTTGETVDPTDPANRYYDTEYVREFPVTAPAVQPLVASTSPVASPNIAGPLYKWVRITPVTRQSAGTGTQNAALFYDGKNTTDTASPGTGQVLSITALAVTPDNSRRLVQSSVVQPLLGTFNAPSAVTLDGNGVSFQGPSGGNFYINGNDMDAPTGSNAGITAIGFTNGSDSSSVVAAATPASNYQSPTGTPPVGLVSLPTIMQTPSGLDALAQTITASADKVITGPVTLSDSNNLMPSGMSATNPVAVVVQGDMTINGWHNTGYGLLLVTGVLKYDPDASWSGIILVIGQGQFISNQSGTGRINGALLIAKTRDSSGNLLPDPNLGAASFSQTVGGAGVYYSSKWVKAAQARLPYQVLSFREIPQQQP